MQKKIIYVDFVNKRKISFFNFLLKRISSYIHLKIKLISIHKSYDIENNKYSNIK
ncbi:hypothetical protein UT300005_25720 [Clostridium sp. CTA-5]